MNTKSHYYEATKEWQEQAKALFFIDHISIGDIAIIVKKARETVSRFLNDCDEYEEEMEFRKQQSAERRREYQRKWDSENRPDRYSTINGESLRREHEMAVRILSSEKY